MSFWRFFRLPSSESRDRYQDELASMLREQISQLTFEIADLKRTNRMLLDRILHMATGAGLEIPKEPEPLSEEAKGQIRKAVDDASEATPFGGHPSFQALLATAEGLTWKDAADNELGVDEVEDGAHVINAKEEETEEQKRARLQRVKETQQAAARVAQEYVERTPPILK